MSIPAQRIDGFSRDFNTPIRDFTTSRDVGIFNTPTLSIEEMIEKGKSLTEQTHAKVIEKISETKEFLEDVTRSAKNQFEKIVNLAEMSESKIREVIDDVFSGFPQKVIDAIKNMGSFCRNNALANGLGAGGNLMNKPNCSAFGLGNANCPPGATRGLLGTIGSDVNRLLKRGLDALRKGVMAIASLLGAGYNANLCNVLSSTLEAIGIEDKSSISIAVAAVLNREGLRGNVGAALDVAKNNVGNLTALAPNAIKGTASNMKLGSNLTSSNIKHAAAAIPAAFAAIDATWNKTETGQVSTEGIAPNADFVAVTDYAMKSETFSEDDLDTPSLSEDSQFGAANNFNMFVEAPTDTALVTA